MWAQRKRKREKINILNERKIKNLDENSIDILVHENKWNERKKNKDGQKNKFLIHK